jgi:hypothetical protein
MRKNLKLEELGDFLEQAKCATLATRFREWREGGFNVAVGAGDIKARHIERDARVSISIAEDTPPYRGIEVRGRATISKEETQEILRRITVRYLGPEQGEVYANMMIQADLALIRIEPGVLRAWDFADEPELAG